MWQLASAGGQRNVVASNEMNISKAAKALCQSSMAAQPGAGEKWRENCWQWQWRKYGRNGEHR